MVLPTCRRAAIALALATFVTVPEAPALARPGDATVTIKNFDFQPMAITVPVGATVSWKNIDGEPHTVTGLNGAFRSEALDQNDTFRFTFAKPGVYNYLCTIHPRMVASVTVK
jgi:plastocyanin